MITTGTAFSTFAQRKHQQPVQQAVHRNLGNETFEDVTAAAGVGDVGDGRTATFTDIDFDGLVDLFSSNHVNSNRMYRNNGNGTFGSDVAGAMTLTSPPGPFRHRICRLGQWRGHGPLPGNPFRQRTAQVRWLDESVGPNQPCGNRLQPKRRWRGGEMRLQRGDNVRRS
ncbi:MAG: VCBS repeat-containing protein [Desulfobacterales bacterium]|nr:VCBS repeat-containing protein [Desulfobacterales bacterium]